MIWFLAVNYSYSQDNVLIKKVGDSYIFIFPSTQGRIKGNSRPAGRIDIGKTITVKYAFEVIGTGKSRFILIDATKDGGITPKLTVEQADKLFGFMLRDSNNKQVDIHIDPSFMQKVPKNTKSALQKEMVREGNLDVVIERKGDTYTIKEARLN